MKCNIGKIILCTSLLLAGNRLFAMNKIRNLLSREKPDKTSPLQQESDEIGLEKNEKRFTALLEVKNNNSKSDKIQYTIETSTTIATLHPQELLSQNIQFKPNIAHTDYYHITIYTKESKKPLWLINIFHHKNPDMAPYIMPTIIKYPNSGNEEESNVPSIIDVTPDTDYKLMIDIAQQGPKISIEKIPVEIAPSPRKSDKGSFIQRIASKTLLISRQ